MSPPAIGEVRVPSRYRAHRLPEAKPTERGILYRRGERFFLLAWSRVKRVLAAEVGESGGPRTVVIDLAVQLTGSECIVCRTDATPGEEAMRLAKATLLGVGDAGLRGALGHLASEGVTRVRFPDVESFEAAALEAVRFG